MSIQEILEQELGCLKNGIPIQLGTITLNKSYRYLYPIMRFYGDEVHKRIRETHKLGVGINDVIYWQQSKLILTEEIFILVDTKGEYKNGKHTNPVTAQAKFAEDLAWLKEIGILRTEYVFDQINGHLHMLVVKIPEDVPHAVKAFVLGKYDLIYTQKQATLLFKSDSVEFKVVTDDKQYRVAFAQAVKNRIDVDIDPIELPGLVGKPIFEQEIFKNRLT